MAIDWSPSGFHYEYKQFMRFSRTRLDDAVMLAPDLVQDARTLRLARASLAIGVGVGSSGYFGYQAGKDLGNVVSEFLSVHGGRGDTLQYFGEQALLHAALALAAYAAGRALMHCWYAAEATRRVTAVNANREESLNDAKLRPPQKPDFLSGPNAE